MSARQTTPKELARLAQCETDDVLIMLWDVGIEYPTSPDSKIKPQHIALAFRACGLAEAKEKTTVLYWTDQLGMERGEFIAYAATRNIRIGENARRLPKGALAKLEKEQSRAVRPTKTHRIDASVSRKAPMAASPQNKFQWEDVGHVRTVQQYLTASDVEAIHFAIAEDFRNSPDPISPTGIRDRNLLESAAERPQTGIGDYKKYATVEMAAAALMHSVVHNHPFYNGNKRTGLVSMLSFLDNNGFTLTCSQTDLFRWTIRVASHRLNTENLLGDRSDIEIVEMARWVMRNSRFIDKGERVVTWAVLRRCLTAFDCEIAPTKSGSRMTISRVTIKRTTGMFSREVQKTKKYILPYGGDGRQVSRKRIKELRRELQLSEDFGVDSASFYGSDSSPVDEFITLYRKTLSRLAKV